MRHTVTIYCVRTDAELIDVLRDCGKDVDVANRSEGGYELLTSEGTLQIAAMTSAAGREFSVQILGAHNYFTNLETDDSHDRERVLATIEECDLILGVRADPPFTTSDARWRSTLHVAEQLHGLIFDGVMVLDPNGDTVLRPTKR